MVLLRRYSYFDAESGKVYYVMINYELITDFTRSWLGTIGDGTAVDCTGPA